MRNILLFFLHPTKYFERIRERQLTAFVVFVIAFYSFTYVFWAIEIEPIYISFYSLFRSESLIRNIFLSFGADVAFSIGLSVAVYLISKLLRLKSRYLTVMLGVFSVGLISTFLMLLQLCAFYVFDNITHIRLWKLIGTLWSFIYFFFAVKTLFVTTNARAAIVVVTSTTLISSMFFLLFINSFQIYANTNVQRGLHYMDLLDSKSAVKQFSDAIDEDPNNAMNYFYLAEAYRQWLLLDRVKSEGLFQKAIEAYNKSLMLDPYLSSSRIGLAKLYKMNKQYNDALKEFEIALSLSSKNRLIYKDIGKTYLDMNKTALAKKYFRLASNEILKENICKENHLLDITDMIEIKNRPKFTVTSQIIWCVEDSILYWGAIDGYEMAETRIHDVYYAILIENILSCINKGCVFDDRLKERIARECNKSILLRKFGIKLVGLDIRRRE